MREVVLMAINKEVLATMKTAAMDARDRAYAPYSRFRVGAAALGASGGIYAGCNVENASYGLTVCAERVAILKAVSNGETAIRAVLIAAGEHEPAPPCGACLQVMAEFSPRNEDAVVVTCSVDGDCTEAALADYLPHPFRL